MRDGLLDDKVAMTGYGTATTRLSTLFSWGDVQEVKGVSALDTHHAIPFHDYIGGKNIPDVELSHFEVSLWKPLLQHVCVMDTPGFEPHASKLFQCLESSLALCLKRSKLALHFNFACKRSTFQN